MDTKWKNRKKAISFLIFFLGVSLTLGGLAGIIKNKPGRIRLWQADQLFEGDYQQSYRFQEYITGRFWSLLSMATGYNLESICGYNGYGSYYRSFGGYEDNDWSDQLYVYEEELEIYRENLENMQDNYEDMLETLEEMQEGGSGGDAENYSWEVENYRAEIEAYKDEMEAYRAEMENYRKETGIYRDDAGSDQTEEKSAAFDQKKKEIAQKYHDWIKGDKNLIYSVSYDGKELYANSDHIKADSEMTAPEGYNFLLYFDGEEVRIVKDGKELELYGDGYYREESDWQEGGGWYVPGYRNFPVSETMKKAKIILAAAEEPVLYMEGYGNGGSGQYDNSLYWMNYNCQTNQILLKKDALYLALGIALLFLAFFTRKNRWEASGNIAGVQAKIWVELKGLLLLGMLYLIFWIIRTSNLQEGWWQELTEIYFSDYYYYSGESLRNFGEQILQNTHPAAWVLLFWTGWLIWNDLRYNKKIRKSSFTGKLYQAYSTKSIAWPLARRMANRSRILLAAAACYVLLMLVMAVQWCSGYRSTIALALLAFSGTAGFLVLAYLTGKKNVETARDMDTLTDCIGEIRNGNYTEVGERFSGHDLENAMAQLEDIRHGLEEAVAEQMRSQRMKVELIANVSHDIKTPLTSIISYVQFLKQEEGLPEHIKDYVRILDQKSQRLKNMVQDVFAVSKAASGELPMHMEALDFGKLLCQTLADMEEQIEGSEVSFRTELPRIPVMIMADGQRMYRVFQNLFQNAIQYSLPGSRVYVSLKTDGTMAVASVKNASRMEIDKEKDFAERFARGDQSRTDGGSGLGLSIAQSFTEACGGEFSWETDADLFVVKVSFGVIVDDQKHFSAV